MLDPITGIFVGGKIAKAAGGFIGRHWPKLVAVAIIAALAYIVADWRGQRAVITDLEDQVEQLTAANETTEAELETTRRAVAEYNTATAEFSAEQAARISQLATALAEEPEIVVEYRDRVQVVEKVITAENCVDALAQSAALLAEVEPPS